MKDTIRINQQEALKTVKQNLENHIKEYKEQMQDYRNAYMVWLKSQLTEMENSAKITRKNVDFDVPFPENHESDYQYAIDILTWSVSDDSTSIPSQDRSIEITVSQFNQWIRNQWGWRHTFDNNTAIYKSLSSR